MRHKWDNRWHKVVTESINTLRIRRMNPRDPLGWKSSFLADCIKWDSQQRNRSCKERNWLEGYSLGHTIAKKVGKLGFENRQDQKTKQYLFDHSQNQAKNHSSEISSAAGHTDHALQSTAWHWIQTPSLKKQLVVAAVPSIYQNGLPTVPASLHLFLLPDAKSGAGWPSLGGCLGLLISKYLVFSISISRGWLRHPTKPHKWWVSPNLEMDSNARKPEKWQMSVTTTDW